MNPIDFLITFFNTFDEGKIFLPTGKSVVKISTRGVPKQVWFSEVNAGNLPVCGGDVNTYGVTLDLDGYVLYANVVTENATLEWQAVLQG